jgi:cell division protein FtsL
MGISTVVKINLMLIMVLIVCALAVVSARHEARILFVAQQKEQARTRDLDVEWGRLQLEISTWLMHNRVEAVATSRLNMGVPDPRRNYVLQSAATPSAGQGGAP